MKRSTGTSALWPRLRLAALGAAMLGALAFLLLRLHDVQVRDRDRYLGEQSEMTLRRVRLPSTRGRILDRNGAVLADNRPRYGAALYLDELRAPGRWSNTVEKVFARAWDLSLVVGRKPELDRDAIWRHLRQRRPIPLVAYRNLSPDELARLAEWPEPLAGVDIVVEQDRVYPFGDLACHVIGYAGRDINPDRAAPPDTADADAAEAGPDESGAAAFDYATHELLGRGGVEKAFDGVLAGRGGAEVLRIDVLGYKRETYPAADPVQGGDVVLSIDAGLQRAAERALGDRRGAAIVLDARNGQVLALASSPRYDLSRFVPSLSSATWRELNEDPERPLLHRALSGAYPAGSVVKPAVALAALGAGAIRPDTEFVCERGFHRNGIHLRCSHGASHGRIAVERALAVSCNAFFVECGLALGWERGLRDAYAALGFGAAPALGIPASAGILPDSAWKKAHTRDRVPWTPGDTANASIGQGMLSVTPMQIALLALALANDGDVLAPHLVLRAGDVPAKADRQVVDHVAWRPADLEIVRRGMVDAAGAHGTARRIGLPSLRLAAKTGTAEFDARDGREHQHAWIIAYEPWDAPERAYAILAEDSDAGGTTAAYILRDILLHIHPDAAPDESSDIPSPSTSAPEEEPAPDAKAAEEEDPAAEAEAAEEDSGRIRADEGPRDGGEPLAGGNGL